MVVLYTSKVTFWTMFWSILIRRSFYNLIMGRFAAIYARVHLVMQNNSDSIQVQMAHLQSPLHFLQNVNHFIVLK